MVRWTLIGAVVVAAGCCPPPAVVKVPVSTPCPEPPAAVRPHLPVADLDGAAEPAAVQKAYAASLEACGGYAEELETVLDGYRQPEKE